ncbi:MAG: STAS domain-containing protein [Planctomycetes bacterium]|nr:STAS domain-containing protein [Planctomycetota bacterium]
MSLEEKRVGTVDVLTPGGPIVDEDAEELIAAMTEKLEQPNPRFVVSMGKVAYIDSRGIEGLVDSSVKLQERGGRLRLTDVTSTCREVLELTGQAKRLDFFDTLQDAVRSFL